MMRSLWSGVSGLQAHQISMDVEGDNIANVNTIGFKYSRANFANMLAQTRAIATAPQGELGGKNALQVGLGSQINAISRIFSQGSIQSTDKNTDVAIQGDGFFVISDDGGKTYSYTRAGDFKFDANGNFVDNNGYIAQGWLRDEESLKIDNANPIQNITIAPGLTTPANATAEISIKANLNSGNTLKTSSSSYAIDGTGTITDSNGKTYAPGSASYSTFDEDLGVLFNASGEAFNLQDGEGMWMSWTRSTGTIDLAAFGTDAAGDAIDITLNGTNILGTVSATAVTDDARASELARIVNNYSSQTGVSASTAGSVVTLVNSNNQGTTSDTKNIVFSAGGGADNFLATGNYQGANNVTAFEYTYASTGASPIVNGAVYGTINQTVRTFTTMNDLRSAMQNDAKYLGNAIGAGGAEPNFNDGISVTVTDQGKLQITNPSGDTDSDTAAEDNPLYVTITGLSNSAVTENVKFTANFQALSGNLATGSGTKTSQAINAATHRSSIDIFDSLGSKHTLSVQFRKTDSSSLGGSEWRYVVTVPKPGTISGESAPFENIMSEGVLTFDNSGSLAGFTIPSISFSANNGSSPEQEVSFNFGTINAFDGLTSFDSSSATSGISQDGYPGGDLTGIRIDQSGTLIGSFSNGRSFGLAQLAMAKFTNNEGLMGDGGNLYVQSANSGDPIIGTAATGGRGFMQASSLEMSNVDLSRALTKLIVTQRGFQANSKTITTSDTMLETLIQLKR